MTTTLRFFMPCTGSQPLPQVLQWKLLSTAVGNPQQWGWKKHEDKYIPVATDLDFAPPDIVKIACCKCSSNTKKPCGTQTCMCRKYGLSCVTACKNCNGISCENVTALGQDCAMDETDLFEDEAVNEADVFDIVDEEIVDDDYLEYFMPWVNEEEVVSINV